MSNQEEQTYRARLRNAYHKLCKSHLVNRKDTSEGSLKFFEERLNEAMPRDDVERDQVRIVKDLYYNAPQLTYRAITAERDGMNKQAPYVLWTNAWCITRHFEIESAVHLDQDATQNMYHVRLQDSVADTDPDPDPDHNPNPDPDQNIKEPPPQKPLAKFEQGDQKPRYQTPRDKKIGHQKPRNQKPRGQKPRDQTPRDQKPRDQKPRDPSVDSDKSDWRTVGEKKYRPRRGKHNERRSTTPDQVVPDPPELPQNPVDTPATITEFQASIEKAIKDNEPWV